MSYHDDGRYVFLAKNCFDGLREHLVVIVDIRRVALPMPGKIYQDRAVFLIQGLLGIPECMVTCPAVEEYKS